MSRRILSVVGLTMVLLVLLVATPALAAPTYDQATDELFSEQNYARNLMDSLVSQGISPTWGWSLGGTTADKIRADILANHLRALGWKVDLERVPLDVLTFKEAYVSVGDTKLPASMFPGVAATPAGGITGEVIYAHRGFANDYAGLGDVTGKLVLIDEACVPLWLSLPWLEAELRGAAGVIFCGWGGATPDFFFNDPDSLGVLPSWYFHSSIPVVYVSTNSGLWLKEQLAEGPTTATMVNDVEYKFAADGGAGHNLVATLRGKMPGRRTIVSAHRDAYWHSALDDTAGCVSAVAMAKAMHMAGYKPEHDLVILLTTGEEWGAVDTLFNYGVGGWHAITKQHPSWAGSTSAFVGLDGPGMKDVLRIQATPEIEGALKTLAANNTGFLPDGYLTQAFGSTMDHWPFASAGVPAFNLRQRTGEFYLKWYHTNYDTVAKVDWEAFADFNKFLERVVRRFDEGLLPYSLSDRANHLAATVDGATLKLAGANPVIVDRVTAAVTEFKSQASAYQSRAGSIRNSDQANKRLLQIAKRMNGDWTSFAAEGSLWYPHAQVLKDTQAIKSALAKLALLDGPGAKMALAGVAMTGYGLNFSEQAYLKMLTLHQPWSPNLSWKVDWDSLTHMVPIPNLFPAVTLIDDGDYAGATALLSSILTDEVALLDKRLADITKTLDWLNKQIPTVR